MEIQLQIFGIKEQIVDNHRYFVYNRICQIRVAGITRRFKHIHLYVFNDMILWVSKRGHWKKTLKFSGKGIVYGRSSQNNKANEPLLFIRAAEDKHPTQILLANEEARDEMLERIRKAHERYQQKQQRLALEKETKRVQSQDTSLLSSQGSLFPPKENSVTNSLTIDESFYEMDTGSQTHSFLPETMTMRALVSHQALYGDMGDDDSSSDELRRAMHSAANSAEFEHSNTNDNSFNYNDANDANDGNCDNNSNSNPTSNSNSNSNSNSTTNTPFKANMNTIKEHSQR
jgi:hypothetical protein